LEPKESSERVKIRQEAEELYEALSPIEKRLENINTFTVQLSNYKEVELANKELNLEDCRKLSIKNKTIIKNIFKKLIKDKENLTELQKDEVIIH
jgi:hypothetical protein